MATHIADSPILRTERGLTIAGTRITIYDVLELLKAEWPRQLIRDYFEFSDEQIDNALNYIEQHRADVEAEYAQVLSEAEEVRQYWELRNCDRIAAIAKLPPKPGMEQAWKKLQTARARRERVYAHPN